MNSASKLAVFRKMSTFLLITTKQQNTAAMTAVGLAATASSEGLGLELLRSHAFRTIWRMLQAESFKNFSRFRITIQLGINI